MKVNQLAALVNASTKSIIGETAVLLEDCSNLVDVGKTLFEATDVENYTKVLMDHIGKVVFVNRVYKSTAPDIMMEAWEYGSILEKIRAEMPEAVENETWNLVDGQTYDENVFRKPTVTYKLFNSKVTFEIDNSITEKQVKSAFDSATQLNAFVSMLYNEVEKSMVIKMDSLVMRTIINFIVETIYTNYPTAAYTASSSVQAINVLKEFNTQFGQTLTKDKCWTNPEFCRFFGLKMALVADRMKTASKNFNIEKKLCFTDTEHMHIVGLSEIVRSYQMYLESDTYNKELVSLPAIEVVPFWQGSGTDYAFTSTSKINYKNSENHTVELDGVVAVMFDKEAIGVSNLDRRVTTKYNAKGEFFNNFYKFEAGYFNDFAENFVVFFVA